MITSTRAGYVKQLSLRVVDVLKVCVIANSFNPLPRRNDLVIEAIGDRAELQTLGEMHRAERYAPAHCLRVVVQHISRQLRRIGCRFRAVDLCRRADEDGDLVRQYAVLDACCKPAADCGDFVRLQSENRETELFVGFEDNKPKTIKLPPGTYRSISVVLRGDASSTSVAVKVVTATLASRFTRGVEVPVTTIVSSWSGSCRMVKLALACELADTVTLVDSGLKPSSRARKV